MATNEILILQPTDEAGLLASQAFNEFLRRWKNDLPNSAVIEHVGATAVPGCLTKGDLDICIRVDPEDFEAAAERLALSFERNSGSVRSDGFSAFMDNAAHPPLGVQLVTKGGELDFFVRFRDRLRESANLLSSYNDLKRRFEGRDMEDYRSVKTDFIQQAISRNS
ncbi:MULTISPECIES: GrpB family protein [unclassified Bradyrhizobium]|uniref:GrpB family protein n=1 Tax=unclassified Bradyrhizobium TaxID=2631580 RepID=UPI001FFAE458|nr:MULTISPECIES: GrpB family protein [unclassified Bradyrhizobium]MCK1609208.1 GrpB family protein [Bradyrhizobium sp. 163]MCK1767318.1 GrpB family protein [Bradyrhizobium sp. 136]